MRTLPLTFLMILFCCSSGVAQKTRGAVSLGYEHLNAQTKTGDRNGLQGWHGILEVNAGKKLGFYFDSANFYAAPENVHSLTGGILFKLKKFGRLSPRIFNEIGESRDSKPTGIVHAFEYAVGPTLSFKLNKHVSLDVCPGEYVLTLPKGDVRNNFAANAGLSFPFGHPKQ